MTRDTLTREQIVSAAIDLLDSEGLEGLNMRALGRRLGSAATAVYWHVGSKDNLIALAGDQAWQEIALPDPGSTDWRTAATQMSAGLHAMLSRHPWLVQAFGSFLMFGPGKARSRRSRTRHLRGSRVQPGGSRPGRFCRLHLRARQRPGRGGSGLTPPQARP